MHVARLRSAGPLWRDEIAVLNLATIDWPEVVRWFPHEGFPLLFLLLLRGYAAALGTGDAALRLFGFGVGVLLLGAIWFQALATQRRVPLIALALLGFHPVLFLWGDSVRGYGIGAALILITFALLARSLVRPGQAVLRAALVSAVLSVQLLLANTFLLLALVCSAVVAHLRPRRTGRVRPALAIGIAAALTLLPYVAAYRKGREWDAVFRIDLSFPWLWGRLGRALGDPDSPVVWVWLLLFAASAVGVAWLLDRRSTRELQETRLAVFAFSTCVLAPIFQLLFLKTLGYLTEDWYNLTLIAVVGVALDTTVGVLAAKRRSIAVLRLAAAVAVSAALAVPAFDRARERLTSVDLVAAELSRRAGREDCVVVAPWDLGISFRRYDRGGTAWATSPPISDLRFHRYDLLKEQMARTDPQGPLLRKISSTLKSGRRVWIVGGLAYPPPGTVPPTHAPAPRDAAGWRETAWMTAWSLELGSFVQRHAVRADRVRLATPTPVNGIENAQLIEVEGWREQE